MSNEPNEAMTFSDRGTPIREETYARLIAALESVYPGKYRRTVEITPKLVTKTIDNEADALETIRRIEERK